MTEANFRGAKAAHDMNSSAEAADQQVPDTAGSRNPEDSDSLLQELEEARKQAAENQDRYLRTRADMENFKKRIERNYADRAESSRKDLLRKLLGVKDNLDRALQYGRGDSGDSGEGIIEGIRLTQYQLEQLLSQEGVDRIDADGKPFDPRYEEAVHRIEDPTVPDHTVIQVVRQGYTYGDDVLRPAQVVVSVHGEGEPAE